MSKVDNIKEDIKNKSLELWQKLNESELPYEDFEEVQDYIINLFLSIN